MSIGEVAAKDDGLFLGYAEFQRRKPNATAFWTKITLKNEFDRDWDMIYYPGDAFTNQVDVYVNLPNGEFKHYQDGVYLPRGQKSIAHGRNEVLVPLFVPANSTIIIYSRVENVDGKPVNFHPRLVQKSAWERQRSKVNLTQGLFQGFLLVLMLYNLVQLVFLGRRYFGYYVAYVAACGVYFLNYYGYTSQWFFGDYPFSYLIIYLLSTAAIPLFYLQFQRYFLETLERIPMWDGLMRFWIFLRSAEVLGLTLILFANFNFDFVHNLHQTFALVEAVFFCFLLIGFYKSGLKRAYFIITGTLLLNVGLVVSILVSRFGDRDTANFYFQGGMLLEVFLFSLALAYKQRQEHEAKLKMEKASLAKAQFLSTMSHEIRTPLNAVIGTTHLLIEDSPRPDQQENLRVLQYSAENLLVLVNDILDFNKIDAGKVNFELTDVDIRELLQKVQNAYEMMAEEKNLYYDTVVDEEVPYTIRVDGNRLSQIITNLVTNAIKFTRVGGLKVGVEVRELSEDKVTLEFSVTDTGIGIPKEKQERVFEEFTQAKSDTTREFGGTGLGLAIIKRLLELQGVAIIMESEEHKGSRFSFVQTFNYIAKAAPVSIDLPNVLNPSEYDSLGQAKVLLVEDNRVNVALATKFLRKWDLQVEVANNGQEGVNLVHTGDYDLVLMDLQMPVMDGYDATLEIRKDFPVLPIIAITASALAEVRERASQVGMNDFVTKPFNPHELYRKIKKHLPKNTLVRVVD